ncbi:GNAT family N-acetyltransferase [Chitinophaga polysaccharea]|uniref:GNAT family N-acetyltransferase n=1 Tax=Chitinophaga polysaccharea TaxID=1293035 RepID=UPI001455C6E0|nr:GNAT family N-acetyltransferase [Chitinophaga polysaccharea]NLR59993.1 GNAT family N-acetyltransferase [Chitinophaga polysaccharea]
MGILNYRWVDRHDAAAITDVTLLSYGQFEAVLAPEYWAQMKHSLSDDAKLQELMCTSATLVCEVDDQLAGVLFLTPSGCSAYPCPAEWAYIRRLGVDPRFRGCGIGRRLVEMAIQQARINGEQHLGLHTSTIMPDARHLYEQLGFRVARELEPILGQQYWLYYMGLS